MRKRTKSKLVNVVFVIVCTAVFAVSMDLFRKDLYRSTVRDDKSKIAQITFKQNVAQRKFDDRVVWERLQNNSPLYDADTIRTSKKSQAVIAFEDKSAMEINLDENTMIQIRKASDGSYGIAVGAGNVTVDTTGAPEKNTKAASVVVSLEDGTKFNVEQGSRLSAAVNEVTGQSNIQLEAGNASVQAKNGEVQKVEAGQSVQVDEKGKVQRNPVTVTSISKDLIILNFEDSETKEVTVQWTVDEAFADSPVVIETSKSKDFKTIESRIEKTGSGSVEIESGQGRLYWRVYAEESMDKAAEGKINVVTVAPVKLVSPVKGSAFTYRKEVSGINFTWEGNQYAQKYRLQIFKESDSTTPVFETETENNFYYYSKLEDGAYSWKVIPFYKANGEGWSKPSSLSTFRIIKLAKVQPPKLSVPAEGTKVSLDANNELKIYFGWKSSVKEADYYLELSDTREFSSNITKVKTSSTHYSLESSGDDKNDDIKLSPGQWFWRVVRNSEEDEENTDTSEIRSFIVEKFVPQECKLLYPTDNFTIESSETETQNFIWKTNIEQLPATYACVLQFAAENDFKKIEIEKTVTSNQISGIFLKEGEWYWRVGLKNLESKEITASSAARKLTVKAPLGNAVFTYPENNSTNVVYGSDTVIVRWNAVRDADLYQVKVFDDQGNLIPQYFNETKETWFAAKTGLEGNFKVIVTAVDEEDSSVRTGPDSSVTFTLRKPVKAQTVLPESGEKIEGLWALRNPVTLKWKKGDDSSDFRILIKKLSPDGSWNIERIISNPKETETIKGLFSGTYSWSVLGNTKEGYPVNSEPASFTITPVPPLEKPVLIEPEEGFLINASYLKKNRKISFDWNEVPDATDYTFALYLRGENGALTKIMEQSVVKSEIKIKNLKLFDIGKFEWHVTAYTHGTDGVTERKSRTARGNFEIKFELPKKVKITESGEQYGE